MIPASLEFEVARIARDEGLDREVLVAAALTLVVGMSRHSRGRFVELMRDEDEASVAYAVGRIEDASDWTWLDRNREGGG